MMHKYLQAVYLYMYMNVLFTSILHRNMYM